MDLSGKAIKVLKLPTVEHKTNVIIIPAKQYDNKSRVLSVVLYDDNGVISLSQFERVSLNATLPNSTKQTATFGTSNFDLEHNIAFIEVPGTFFSLLGRVVCDLTFYGEDGESLSSQNFTFIVYPGQYSEDAVTGSSEYSALQSLIAEVEKYKKDIEDHLMDISYVEALTDNYMMESALTTGEALSSVAGANFGIPVSSANTANSATSDFIAIPQYNKPSTVYLSYGAASGNRGFTRFTRVMFYNADKTVITEEDGTNPNYSAGLTSEEFGVTHTNGGITVPTNAAYIRFTVNVKGVSLSQFMVCGVYRQEYIASKFGYQFNKPIVGYLTESEASEVYAPKSLLDDFVKKETLDDYTKTTELESYAKKSDVRNEYVAYTNLLPVGYNFFPNAIGGKTVLTTGRALSIIEGTFGKDVQPSANADYVATSEFIFLPTGTSRHIYPTYRSAKSGNRGNSRFTRMIFYTANNETAAITTGYYSANSLLADSFAVDNPGGYIDVPDSANYVRFTVNLKDNEQVTQLDEYMLSYTKQDTYKEFKPEYQLDRDLYGYAKKEQLENYAVKTETVSKTELEESEKILALTIGETYLSTAMFAFATDVKIVPATSSCRRVYYLPIPQKYKGLSLTAMNDYGNYIAFGSFHTDDIDEDVRKFAEAGTSITLSVGKRNMAPSKGGKSYFNGDSVTITPQPDDNYLCLALAINDDFVENGSVITDTDKIDAIYNDILATTRIIVEDTGLIHAPYESAGAYYAVKKADQFLDFEWTPIKNMPRTRDLKQGETVNDAVFSAGTKVKGLPYSSVKAMSRFIGIDVLPETFATALENKNSILYSYDARAGQTQTKEKIFPAMKALNADTLVCKVTSQSLGAAVAVSHVNAGSYYGTVCSSLVGYAIGMPTYETTYSWRNTSNSLRRLADKSCFGLKRGDTMLQANSGGGGHTSLISDIERDETGNVRFITVTESSHPVVKQTRYAPAEFVDKVLTSAWDNGVIPTNDIYRYNRLDYNRCIDYDGSLLRKSGSNYCMYLDASIADVGCVFLDDVEIYDYSYDTDTCLLSIPVSSVSTNMQSGTYVQCRRVKVGPLDTWRSYFVPASSYNHNPLIQLNRGNKSVYRHSGDVTGYGDNIVFTVNASTAKMRIYKANGDPVQSEPFVATTNANYDPDTKVCVIDAGTLTPGYYTACVVVNKEVTDAETGEKKTVEIDDPDNKRVEFLVYETGEIAIANTLDDTGTIQLSEGKIKGSVSGFSDELTPYYVELCNVNNVVRYTAFVQNSGNQHTFEISVPSIDESNGYIKVHYKCRYGRVVTETYKIYAVDAGVITVEQYKEITGQNYQA